MAEDLSKSTTAPTAGWTRTFIQDLSFAFVLDEHGTSIHGTAEITPTLEAPGDGWPRPSVLLTVADIAAGVALGEATRPDLVLTLDAIVRIVRPKPAPRLRIAGEVVRTGRNIQAAEVRFEDVEDGALVATSYFTFVRSPRPQDKAPDGRTTVRVAGTTKVPFPEHVGIRTIEPGVVEVDRTPFNMQAAGSIQGGIIALLGEMAAESLTGRSVLDLECRYVSAARVGPAWARATRLSDDLVQIKVHDRGRDDRLVALIMTRTAS